jgi:hypothetical protein
VIGVVNDVIIGPRSNYQYYSVTVRAVFKTMRGWLSCLPPRRIARAQHGFVVFEQYEFARNYV